MVAGRKSLRVARMDGWVDGWMEGGREGEQNGRTDGGREGGREGGPWEGEGGRKGRRCTGEKYLGGEERRFIEVQRREGQEKKER